jgi:phosphoribosylformimino-5-aminoimidazole carboxamide ribotide isomerase
VSGLTVIPAIDLKGGRCVRLLQGREDAVTVYGDDPVAMARHWVAEGAARLHVVDLDGAFRGTPMHSDAMAAIIRSIDIPVQVGGGLRSEDDVQAMVDAGADRVILGTRACQDPAALSHLVAKFGGKIAVGIDARDGKVQVKGWTETTGTRAVDLAKAVAGRGVGTIIVTDTATDGMLQGPNLPTVQAVCDAVGCGVIASGGVSAVRDVSALARLARPNLRGVIVGKALYEGRATLRELQEAAGHE